MTVRNLSPSDFDVLLQCFLLAFENYFVEMPTDRNYYKQKWAAAKVDYTLSYGMFQNQKMVGFIIHAVDTRNGIRTAHNIGTGVLPEFRNQKVVRAIYNFALPDLRKNGVLESTLEVITKNQRAIKAYQNIGFRIAKTYRCFKGALKHGNTALRLEEIKYADINWSEIPNQHTYAWEYQKESLANGNYKYYKVFFENHFESFFAINPDNGKIAQFEILANLPDAFKRLFTAISTISKKVIVNNVDENLTEKIDFLNQLGLEHYVNQYQMKLVI